MQSTTNAATESVTEPVSWTRSSRCTEGGGTCFEVASVAPDTVLVRDSKNPDQSNVQIYSRAEWNAFLAGVRHGDFDHI